MRRCCSVKKRGRSIFTCCAIIRPLSKIRLAYHPPIFPETPKYWHQTTRSIRHYHNNDVIAEEVKKHRLDIHHLKEASVLCLERWRPSDLPILERYDTPGSLGTIETYYKWIIYLRFIEGQSRRRNVVGLAIDDVLSRWSIQISRGFCA